VIGRRRRDGDLLGSPGGGLPDPSASRAPRRVQGAWETPAVVVRGPDGEVLSREEAQAFGRRRPAAARRRTGAAAGTAAGSDGSAARAEAAAPDGTAPPDGNGSAPRRPRVRPRRIPGAAGGVLVVPTLLREADDGRLARRARRRAAPDATVSALALRGRAARDLPAESAGGRSGRSSIGRRRGPSPAHPGDSRPSRPLEAVAPPRSPRTPAWLRRAGTKVSSLGVASAVVYVVVLAVVVYTVFPVRTYLNQRAATDRARTQIEVIHRANERLEKRADELRDPDTIEQLAREDLGMVKPGEESYGILPAPQQPAPDPAP
jgi:cell division protein FtsB